MNTRRYFLTDGWLKARRRSRTSRRGGGRISGGDGMMKTTVDTKTLMITQSKLPWRRSRVIHMANNFTAAGSTSGMRYSSERMNMMAMIRDVMFTRLSCKPRVQRGSCRRKSQPQPPPNVTLSL